MRATEFGILNAPQVACSGWQRFALGATYFAAVAALLGKVGVTEINSNLATLIRTVVIRIVSAWLVSYRGKWKPLTWKTAFGGSQIVVGWFILTA